MGREKDNKDKDRGIIARNGRLYIDVATAKGRHKKATGLDDTPANRRTVRSLIAELRAQAVLGKLGMTPKAKDKPFGEYAHEWITSQAHLAKTTAISYRSILNNHILPTLGNRNIAEITATEVSSVLASKSWGNAKTMNSVLGVAKLVFSSAANDGLIKTDPAARIKMAKTQHKEPQPLTQEDVEAVLCAVEAHWKPYFEVAFFTGLRTSELLALKRSDIDPARRLLRVERAYVKNETKCTKTGKSRFVELSRRALRALQEVPGDGPTLFTTESGEPIRYATQPWRAWDRALKKVGLPHRAAYQTRHTYATMYLMKGANPAWIAKQLGHANMGMLLETYGRWISYSDNNREADRLDEARV